MPSDRNGENDASVRSRAQAGLAAAYFCYYAFLGMATVYFAPWLVGRGMSLSTVAIIGTIVLLATTAGQAGLALLTRRLSLSGLMLVSCIGALAGVTGLFLSRSPAALMVAAAVTGLCAGPCLALLDALALDIAHRGYGRLRAFGSAGFAFAATGGGFAIDRLGVRLVVPLEGGALLLLLGSLLLLPKVRSLPAMAGKKAEPVKALRQPLLWLLMLSVAAINASHAYYYLFGDIVWADRMGHGHGLVGLLWSIGIGSEILLLALVGARDDGRWPTGLMLAGAAAAAIRWSATAFDPPLPLLALLQTLHGLSYAATLLGGICMLRLMVPESARAGVLGLFAALIHGVVIGGVTVLLGGPMATDSRSGFLLMAALAVTGGAGVIALRWCQGLPATGRRSAAGRSP